MKRGEADSVVSYGQQELNPINPDPGVYRLNGYRRIQDNGSMTGANQDSIVYIVQT